MPSEEGQLTRLLRERNADLLLDADIERKSLYALVYIRGCTIITGQPARFVRSGGGE